MIVQEKIYKEGNHIADRINELGLKCDEWKLLDWSPVWAIIFYDNTGMRWDESADIEGTAGLKGKWMKMKAEEPEEEEGFGIKNKKLAGQK